MLEFLKEKKPTQVNKDAPASGNKELAQVRKRVGMQLGLAILTVLLTVVIVIGMTAAWYTNVVHSGGLIFEVEKMGVDVDATVNATTFTAQPGDQGIISLEASNQGNDLVNVTVSINKSAMDAEMQKRLYFFVEHQATANGETSQRSYITATTGYTYMLFNKNALTLTENYHNNAQLKWCWVYDVLGYYVLGQARNGQVEVGEYLRPIEYDYDWATFDRSGNLLTVDGTTTAENFLVALSQTDGYAGEIDPARRVGGYYPVDVDETGYGVYAYLCTREEVEANTDYDTQLGQAALDGKPGSFTVRMTVNAEIAALQYHIVTSAEELQNLLKSGENVAVKLGSDLTLEKDEVLNILSGSHVYLDLNDYTLTTNNAAYAVILRGNSSLTLSGGSLAGSDGAYGFRLYGGDLTMHDVDMSGYATGIAVTDYGDTGKLDSSVHMTNCTMHVAEYGFLIYGNGLGSSQDSRLILENCEIVSGEYGICGNGSIYGDGRFGTDIQIIGSSITQNSGGIGAAIYHPQRYGTLNIVDSVISGYNAVVMKGGVMRIADSKVIGTGTVAKAPSLTSSGYSDTADAIYVETGYGYDIHVTLHNVVATSDYSLAFRVYEENSPYVTIVEEGQNIFVDKSKETSEP